MADQHVREPRGRGEAAGDHLLWGGAQRRVPQARQARLGQVTCTTLGWAEIQSSISLLVHPTSHGAAPQSWAEPVWHRLHHPRPPQMRRQQVPMQWPGCLGIASG